jgi:cellulose 1,4-beta-cellobiosidase
MRTHKPGRARNPQIAAGATVAGAIAVVAASLLILPSQGADAGPATLCGGQQASVGSGIYIVQNNEYNSSANECVTTDGGADFTVATSDVANPPGAPGSYPSIYQGCHWGSCSTGELAANPIRTRDLTAGEVTTSWSTTQPAGTGSTYDVAYDIWFNHAPTTGGAPDCAEVMIWLGHQGSVQPYGSTVGTNVSLGGLSYTVWEGVQTTEPTISYELTTPATSVTDLDLYPIARDAVSRGYISESCYLVDVEAGFELWQGGAGLATNSFSVQVGGATSSPTPSPTPTPTPTSTPSPTSTATPTPTSTPSSTATTTATATASPSPSASQSEGTGPSPTPSETPAPTASVTASTPAARPPTTVPATIAPAAPSSKPSPATAPATSAPAALPSRTLSSSA